MVSNPQIHAFKIKKKKKKEKAYITNVLGVFQSQILE